MIERALTLGPSDTVFRERRRYILQERSCEVETAVYSDRERHRPGLGVVEQSLLHVHGEDVGRICAAVL